MAATGVEIASAYVAITVKAPGIKRDIVKEFGGVDMSKLGSDMGSKLADGMKKTLKVAGATVGATLVAGIGTALVKGFSRLNSIDQATAKLKGLGNSASDVDKIMGNALASVKGTAFGLDAAATTAAGAVAAGIKPGRELEGVLKSVANSAAASGTGMDEMGSIYNKVASLGKAQNDSLQQVADRGLPIYQALATQMGVTTDEVFKMASAGEIGFKEFETAMTTAAGTVASEMGNTVAGSWANFMSSLGRIGAGALGGVWSSLAPVLQATTNALGPLEAVAASVGEKIGTFLAPAIEWLINSLNNGVDFSMFSPLGLIFEALAPVLPVVSDALKGIASTIGGALAGVLPTLLPPLGEVLSVLGELVAAVLPPLAGLLSIGADLFGTLVTALSPLISALVGALAPVLKALSPIIVVLAEALTPIIQLIADLLTPVIGFLSEALTWVVGIITDAITNAIPWLGQAFQNVWNVIKPVFDGIAAVFKWVWDSIINPIIGYIKLSIQAMGLVFNWLWVNVLQPVFAKIGEVFNWIWVNIINPIVEYIKISMWALGQVFDWLWVNAIKPAIDNVGRIFEWLYNTIIKPVWEGISNTIKNVWEKFIKPVIDTLVKVIKSDPKLAFEAARDAIGKAWAGIQDLAKKPVKFVVETVINGLINTVNGILPEGMKIPTVKLPKGFSEGGYTGNLAASAVAGVVHGNEHVIRASSRKAIESRHPGLLDHMNQHGSIPGYRTGGLVNPLPQGSYSVSQPYHGGHNGIDLAAAAGTKVFAAGDGVVGLAGSVNMGGNEVYVQHANGLGTRYSHLSRFGTQVGAQVKAGNVIGYVGSTGMSTGPHLHYMVHSPGGGAGNYGNHVNPAGFMGLNGQDLGEAGGSAGILGGLVDWAVGQIKGAFPGGGMFIDVATNLAMSAATKMAEAFNPFAASDGHTGTTLYDNGGLLQPGVSLVENKTGRPEPILTGSQWDAVMEGRGASGPVRVFIGEREFEGWMDERSDAAVDRGIEDVLYAGRRANR